MKNIYRTAGEWIIARTLVAAPQKFGGASAVNKQAFHCFWLARTLQNFAVSRRGENNLRIFASEKRGELRTIKTDTLRVLYILFV